MTEAREKHERLPVGTPVVYCDNVMDILFGTATTKLILGLETDANQVRPVATVILPTSALIWVAYEALKHVSAPAMVQETGERFGAILEFMRDLSTKFPPEQAKDDVTAGKPAG